MTPSPQEKVAALAKLRRDGGVLRDYRAPRWDEPFIMEQGTPGERRRACAAVTASTTWPCGCEPTSQPESPPPRRQSAASTARSALASSCQAAIEVTRAWRAERGGGVFDRAARGARARPDDP